MTDAPDAWEHDQRRLAEERRSRLAGEHGDATALAEARAERLTRRVGELEAELRRRGKLEGPAARQELEHLLRAAEAEAAAATTEVARLSRELRRIRKSRTWRALRFAVAVKRSGGRPRAIVRAAREARTAPAPPDVRKGTGRKKRAVVAPTAVSSGPAVCVIVHVAHLDEAVTTTIDSVVAQTIGGLELILCGEGALGDAAVGLLDRARDLGPIKVLAGAADDAVGEAARMASARYLCEIRAPIRLHPTYLEKAVVLLDAHQSVESATAWVRTLTGDLWRPGSGIPAGPGAPSAPAVFRRGSARPPALGATREIAEPLLAELTSPGLAPPAAKEPTYSPSRSLQRLGPGRGRRPVVVTAPWFTLGGGDRVVEALLRHWRDEDRHVVAVTTLDLGKGMVDRFEELLELTPFAYHLPRLLPRKRWVPFLADLIGSLDDPAMLNVGSPWAYQAIPKLRERLPDLRIVDQQFNNSVHMPSNSMARESIDLTVAAYPGLVDLICADGRPRESVEVVPVGIPPLELPGAEEMAGLRATLGIPDQNRVVSFIGRLSSEKRPEWVLALAADLAAEDGLTVVIVGDGPLADTLQPGIEAVPRLVWRRALDRVGPLLAGSDLVILPSETEGIPLVAMEALQLGVPVVATRVGGMPTLEHDPLVDLCDPTDYPGFVTTVRTVLGRGRPERRPRPDAFSLREMLEHYDRVLDEKLG